MSEPRTINAYLAALNGALEVGLRSRRRILTEVEDHLWEAMQRSRKDGVAPHDAQRRAITAFGGPEEVAARFDAGLLGAVDRRLAIMERWLYWWTVKRPYRQAAMWIVVSLLVGGMVSAVGVAFDATDPPAGLCFVGGGMYLAMMPSEARRFGWYLFFGYSSCLAYLGLTTGETSPEGFALTKASGIVLAGFLIATAVTNAAVRHAAREYLGVTEDGARQAWSENHRAAAALAGVARLPVGITTFLIAAPGPWDLRIALIGLVVVMTALAAAGVLLEQGRQAKVAYRPAYADAQGLAVDGNLATGPPGSEGAVRAALYPPTHRARRGPRP